VYVGVAGTDAEGEPVSIGKPYSIVKADGKVKSTSGVKFAPPPKVNLGAWQVADNESHIAGESPRYAGIDGPESLAALGTPYGYGWYRAAFKQGATKRVHLALPESGDRVQVIVDGQPAGVLGEGPGASAELSVSLKKGDRTIVLLADNMGRRVDATGSALPIGVEGHIREVSGVKPGKPEIVVSEPIHPLTHEKPLMRMRENDAAFPERVVWKIMHRKKSPLHIALGPCPVRGVLMVNEAYAGLIEPGETFRKTLDGDDLHRGNNVIEFAPMDDPAPESTMAKLASSLAGVFTVTESVSDLSAKAAWAFAKWETPQDAVYDSVAKARLGDRAVPTWWMTEFDLPEVPVHPVLLDLSGMTKGQVYVNGSNLGRYFVATADGSPVEPGGSMLIPSPWLASGLNTVTVFDEHGGNPAKIRVVVDGDRKPVRRNVAAGG
jgi:hypothetical protein